MNINNVYSERHSKLRLYDVLSPQRMLKKPPSMG